MTPARTASAPKVAVAGLAALAVAMGIGRFAFTPILPMMQEDSGLTVPGGAWLASANYLGYLLGALSAMALRAPPGILVRTGLFGTALLTLAMAIGSNFFVWFLWRLLAGVASAWVLVFASTWCLNKLAELQRPSLGGVAFAGVGTGICIAGLFCLSLMQFGFRADHAWVGLGALTFLVAVWLWPMFAGEQRSASLRTRNNGPTSQGDSRSLRLVICYGVFGFGYIIPATFLPAMAKQAVTDPLVFGWSWPVFGLAAVVSTLAASALRAWASNVRLWRAAQLLLASGVVLPALQPGIGAILLAALFVGSTFMVITMAGLQEARAVAGIQASRLIATMTTSFALGQIVGPIVAGYAVRVTGSYAFALLVASALLVAAALLLPRSEAQTTTTAAQSNRT